MKKIDVIIERADEGTYSAYCVDEQFSGMGDTPEAAKKDLESQIHVYREYCKEERVEYPSWLDNLIQKAYCNTTPE